MIPRREFIGAAGFAVFALPEAAAACRDAAWSFGSERAQLNLILERFRGRSPSLPEGIFGKVEPTLTEMIEQFRSETIRLGAKKVQLVQFVRIYETISLVNFQRRDFDELIVSCDRGILGVNNYFLVRFRDGRMDAFEKADIFNPYDKVALNA